MSTKPEEAYRYELLANKKQLKALLDTCKFGYCLHNGLLVPTLLKYSMQAYTRHYKERNHCEPDNLTSQTARIYQYCVKLKELGWGNSLIECNGENITEYGNPFEETDETSRILQEMESDFEQALKLRKGYIYSVGKSLSVKRMEHKPRNPLYVIHISHRQLRELSFQCEQHSRFITGQLDFTLQEAVESAWEKRYADTHPVKDNGYKDHGIGTKEWYDVRHNTEAIINDIRWECWQCTRSSSYGVHYDDESDMYWDIYEVFRHQLWLDRPDEKKCGYTVDAYPAHQWGNEPLIKIKRINNN